MDDTRKEPLREWAARVGVKVGSSRRHPATKSEVAITHRDPRIWRSLSVLVEG